MQTPKDQQYLKLINKSVESFLLGIEIYNKPSIKYRVEGFSFFICNAWELMLKAHIIKIGEASIYYKDNPERTISLEKCLQLVFTNNKDPLRINLEKIIELRNTSTHYITEEYEMVYIPLFQSCVLSYSDKMMKLHNFDITKVIPQNFLTLNISMEAIDDLKIKARYPEEIANKLIKTKDEIEELSSNLNHNFSLKIEHHHYLTKDRSEATSLIGIDNNAQSKVKIIKELKDPNNTHPYNVKGCIKEISKQLIKDKINVGMNQYTFLLFVNHYNLKTNVTFCYQFKSGDSSYYLYSRQTIDLIVNEIKKDPANIIQNLKNKLKLTPGAKEF